MSKIINYRKVKIGKLSNDDESIKGIVMYYNDVNVHVTLYEEDERTLSKYMLKSDWTIVRDSLGLTLYDIDEIEIPF